MDTEIADVCDLNERRRWGENVKVYTRRFRKKSLKGNKNWALNVIALDTNDDKSKEIDCYNDINDKNIDTSPDQSLITLSSQDLKLVQEKGNDVVPDQAIHIVATNDLNLVQEDNGTLPDQILQTVGSKCLNTVQEKHNDSLHNQSLQFKATEDLSSVQERVNVSQSNSGCDGSLSDHNQPLQVAIENGYEELNGDESLKPIIIKVDGRVRISLALARPRNEVRELKRKLEDELYQVRNLVQRLEAKRIQLTNYSAGNNGVYSGSKSHLHSQAKEVVSLARVNSGVGSVGNNNYYSRPFQHLSVQVFENSYDVAEFEKEKRTPKENQYYRSSEFLLAKDRLPPADNNKKLKTNGMRKYGGDVGYGFVMNKYTTRAFKSCNNLLARLMRHKFAWVFNKPVDAEALGLHDYHYIIRNPMDLGTIKSRLAKNWYKFPKEFAEDVRLTFHNAMMYNPIGHDVHVIAEQLLSIFEDKWAAIESEYNYDRRYGLVHDMNLPNPSSRKVHPPPPSLSRLPTFEMTDVERVETLSMPIDSRLKPNTPVGRTPVPKKPKAKDPHKREMTSDEKQRLSIHLQNLPSDKLDALVQIIKKGTSSLSQHDDEIELDIDSVDTETLWELDRFVTNYKKNLSKRKRRAELALQARAEAKTAVPTMNNVPATTQAPKASVKDHNNVATLPLPGERPGESSSSSSSSSDSDSDSSDSDSDSSSGYQSGAGNSPKT